MYTYEIVPSLLETLRRLSKKDLSSYDRVMKKIEEIINSDVLHYKDLRHDLKGRKRVHVGHFVLVFHYIQDENKIVFLDFDHHDKIYK